MAKKKAKPVKKLRGGGNPKAKAKPVKKRNGGEAMMDPPPKAKHCLRKCVAVAWR